jgi:hypothetical protein
MIIFFTKTASPALGFTAYDTLSMGGWMSPGTGQDFEVKRKICSYPESKTGDLSPYGNLQ